MSVSGFQVWDADRAEDARAWLELWNRWPKREVFAHPRYIGLEARTGSRMLCATLESDDCHIIYPFVLRELRGEPYCPARLSTASDMVTPYGYGGPFCWGDGDRDAAASVFWKAFEDWASEQTVVSEFVRFTLFSEDTLPYPGRVRDHAWNVVRDLELTDDACWMDFEHKVRKNVKKALRNGLRIELDPTGVRLEDFLRLYTATMDRNEASEHYYFPESYFETIHRELPGSYMYFHVTQENRFISTELVLLSAENVYSFLGGTERSSFELCPNDLLKYEVVRWAKEQGKKRFVLGGGYRPDDGIYRYKLAFAPRGRVSFRTGQRIFREDLYNQLVDSRRMRASARGSEWAPQPDYFPSYRS
jgi:hypothetical protein